MRKNNFERVAEQIREALSRSGRTDKIKLIAVSKLQSTSAIRELHSFGVTSFGENYLQEFKSKQQELEALGLEWHYIGQIQSNKAKDLVGAFAYIHSVDRLKVAARLNQSALEQNLRQKILVEVNLADEDTKGGLKPSELEPFLRELSTFRSLQVSGLMVMPPLAEDPERLRAYFKEAKVLLKKCQQLEFWDNDDKAQFKELSMGTSQDFHVAIEEGATMVRIGTVIFGPRPLKKDSPE